MTETYLVLDRAAIAVLVLWSLLVSAVVVLLVAGAREHIRQSRHLTRRPADPKDPR